MSQQVTIDRDALQDLVDFVSPRWDDLTFTQRYALSDAKEVLDRQARAGGEIPGQQRLF